MAIEIKGLKADALKARAHLDRIRAAYAKFNEAAPAHAADVEGLGTQITSLQSDLEFAANLLGNSGAASGDSGKVVERQAVIATVGDANEPKLAAERTVARQEGASAAATTFRGEDDIVPVR